MGPLHTYITAKNNMYYTLPLGAETVTGDVYPFVNHCPLSWSVNIKTTADVIIAEKRVCLSKCGI